RLGWSHGDQELFSVDEMVALFDLEEVNKSASTFNTDKLLWLNQHYITEADPAHLARELSWHVGRLGIDPADGPDLVEVVRAQQGRAKTLVELAGISAFFYRDPADYEPKAAKKHLGSAALEPLGQAREALEHLEPWTPEAIHGAVEGIAQALDLGMGKVAQPLRVAVSGRAATPGIDVTLHLVGREATLRRIDRALGFVEERADGEEQD
ncbi:MAG: glutamate--tRNA ligase, partial [Gammaproteobacteria bacterium]|nr:glutamate--tRNA ligase [Gammaproteobacteria bacterium]